MSMDGAILVGDVGGTNVRFAIAHRRKGAIALEAVSKTPGDDYDGFDDALAVYLDQLDERPKTGVLAFAAPINGPIATLTNRDWTVDADALKTRFGFHSIRLANDFEAMARSVTELADAAFTSLKTGVAAPDAPIVVAGPGTGFGMATLIPDDQRGWRVISGEGGHQAFAPQNALEWALAERLRARHDFVVVETVTGGAFMDDVHRALCDIHGVPYRKTAPGDLINAAAEGDAIARDLCQIRAETSLTAMADAILALGARGGGVVAGGVAERLETYLNTPRGLARLTARGVRSDFMKDVPVQLLIDGDAPLIGAAALSPGP